MPTFSGIVVQGSQGSAHTSVAWRQAEGIFYYIPHDPPPAPWPGYMNGIVERRLVDGTIERYEGLSALVGGHKYYRPIEFIDPYDNRTKWEYDLAGRVERVCGPDGVDEVWDYSPSWIGGAGDWSATDYSGIEITYVDRTSSDQNLLRTERRLFRKRKDASGNFVPGTGPHSGDPLYRVYGSSGDFLDDLLDANQDTLFDLSSDRARMQVVEFSYVLGTSLIATISRFTADGPLPGDASSTKSDIVSYTYVTAGGRKRVHVETQPRTGRQYTFSYVDDSNSPNRVQTVARLDHNNTLVQWTLDDYERVTSITTTPTNDAAGRPRAFDPDNGGYVEPVSITRNYTYSACGACAGKASVVEDLPSGRRWEYDYDDLTGLLLESRVPNPDGSAVPATTQYSWEPSVAGKIYGAYKLTSILYPDGSQWTLEYSSVPRQNPIWGVKHDQVKLKSPLVTIAGSGPQVILEGTTTYNVAHPDLDAQNRQSVLVGQELSATDFDGIQTVYTHDANGLLASIVESSGGAEDITTGTVFGRTGDLTRLTLNMGSALSHVVDYTYDGSGQLKTVTSTVSGQPLEERLYYDGEGHLVVQLHNNRTHSGGLPDDFGPTPRADVARPWIRREHHYFAGRLVMALTDRRALDRDDGPSDPITDAIDARFARTDYFWSADGWLLQVATASGAATSFTYDGYGALYKSEQVGAATTLLLGKYFLNDDFELMRELRGDGGLVLVSTITRNAAGSPTQVTEPLVAAPGAWYPGIPASAVLNIDWDIMGQVTETRIEDAATQALLATRTTTFDEIGRSYVVSVVDPGGDTQTYTTTWAGLTQATKTVGPGGRVIERAFDALGRLEEVLDGLPSNPNKIHVGYVAGTNHVEKVSRYEWDDLEGVGGAYVIRATEYVRDTLGRALEVRDGPSASPLVYEFEYYGTGQTESYTDPAGKVHRYLPDALHRLREYYLPGVDPIWNGAEFLDWTGVADRSEVKRTDARGRVTRSIFDFAGRAQAVMNPGATTEPTALSPHQAFAQYFAYDSASRLTGVYKGDGIHVQVYRDGVGRLIARSTASAGTNFVSLYHGRDILARNALGQVTSATSAFGPDGSWGVYLQQTFDRDALGRTERESFKFSAAPWAAQNWVDIESTFSGGDWFRSGVNYDNNLANDVDDLWVDRVPDPVGRLQSIEWRSTSAGNADALASYLHRGARTRQRTTHWGLGASDNFDTDYRYDDYGRMDRIEQSFSASATVDFHYDLASNLVKEVYQKQGGASQAGDRFTYDEHHRLERGYLGSDTVHLGQPDPEVGTGTFVKRLTYGLDTANNRTQVDTYLSSTSTTTTAAYSTQDLGESQGPSNRYDIAEGAGLLHDQRGNLIFDGNLCYVYDDLDRLSEVYVLTGDGSSSSSTQSSGTSLSSFASIASVREYEAERGPFVITDSGALRAARARIMDRIPGGPAATLARHRESAFRSLLSEGLPITAASRLVSPSSTTSSSLAGGGTEGATMTLVAVYQYDAMNRRVARHIVGFKSWFTAWDGWQEGQEMAASGATVVPERQFVWGEQLDELVAYRYRKPGQGSLKSFHVAEGGAHCPSRILDDQGVVVEIQEYDPYGKASFFDGTGASLVAGAQLSVGNPFQWKGHRVDPETGLTYMRNRYYSSAWGRFLTTDPLGVWGDSVSLGNAYGYAANEPLVGSDRFGLQSQSQGVEWIRNGSSYSAIISPNQGTVSPSGEQYTGEEPGRVATISVSEVPESMQGLPTVGLKISGSDLAKLYENGTPAPADGKLPNDLNGFERELFKLKHHGDERIAVGAAMVGAVVAIHAAVRNIKGLWKGIKNWWKGGKKVGKKGGASTTGKNDCPPEGKGNQTAGVMPSKKLAAKNGAKAAKQLERQVKKAEEALRRDKNFRRYFHREFKPSQKSPGSGQRNPNLSGEQVLEAFKEWQQRQGGR